VANEKLELVYDTIVHYGDRPHRPDPQFLNLGVKYKDIKPENGAQLYEDVLEALKAVVSLPTILPRVSSRTKAARSRVWASRRDPWCLPA
jgi:hypothetical protein